jgi:hypothetical protein
MHHNNKTKKLTQFSFLLSHITPTKQNNSIKQDLSLFRALPQQNRKINEVFLHPVIVAIKKQGTPFCFIAKILKFSLFLCMLQ